MDEITGTLQHSTNWGAIRGYRVGREHCEHGQHGELFADWLIRACVCITLYRMNGDRNESRAMGRSIILYEISHPPPHTHTHTQVGAIGFSTQIAPWLYPLRLVKMDMVTEQPYRDPATGFCVECDVDEPGQLVSRISRHSPLRSFDGYVNQSGAPRNLICNVFETGDQYFASGMCVCWCAWIPRVKRSHTESNNLMMTSFITHPRAQATCSTWTA